MLNTANVATVTGVNGLIRKMQHPLQCHHISVLVEWHGQKRGGRRLLAAMNAKINEKRGTYVSYVKTINPMVMHIAKMYHSAFVHT